jgi:uncharacterized RDD family membrane protein YckC
VPAPEKLTIDTPEQIALEFPLASVGSRFLAIALDTLVQAGLFLAFLMLAFVVSIASAVAGVNAGVWGAALAILAGFTLYYGYFAAFEALWNGQTPGKRWVGLRVISETGRPIGAFDAILRNLLRIVDQLPAIYAVGTLSVFLTSRNQRLGDLAAGTVVVHDRPVDRPVIQEPSAPAATTRYGANRLSPEEIAAIDTYLRRRWTVDDHFRVRARGELATRIRPKLTMPADTKIEDEALLEQVMAEYRGGLGG